MTPRSKRWKRWCLAALSLAFAALFTSLGIWQIERRTSKLELLKAVDHRVHAPAQLGPGPAGWPAITAKRDAYRHVTVEGRFLRDRDTLVQAVTEDGAGFWVMTPLQTDDGFIVLVNRGFVPKNRKYSVRYLTSGHARVTGLLRVSEPAGSILRANDNAQDRWFSRDVPAIAHARALQRTAPYFIDADATPNPGGWPRGGLTVVAFPNNHLIYSVTWFGLATLSLAGLVICLRGARFADEQDPSLDWL
jgi:surfeit locus 1 family protein